MKLKQASEMESNQEHWEAGILSKTIREDLCQGDIQLRPYG